jgi:hypothetical protein
MQVNGGIAGDLSFWWETSFFFRLVEWVLNPINPIFEH